MSFDRLVRQQRKRRRKSSRLSKAMTRMSIGQFWPQRGALFIGSTGTPYHQDKWADTVMTPFRLTTGPVLGTGGQCLAVTGPDVRGRW